MIIHNISSFYQTRSKLTKPSSNKFDEAEIQNLIASSSDLTSYEAMIKYCIFTMKLYANPLSQQHTLICMCYGVHIWQCIELLIAHARCYNREKLITYSLHVHKITSELNRATHQNIGKYDRNELYDIIRNYEYIQLHIDMNITMKCINVKKSKL